MGTALGTGSVKHLFRLPAAETEERGTDYRLKRGLPDRSDRYRRPYTDRGLGLKADMHPGLRGR